MSINIYTDGACSGNPGVGGWGAGVVESKKQPIPLNGGAANTTNNQMELMAAIKALQYFNEKKILRLLLIVNMLEMVFYYG